MQPSTTLCVPHLSPLHVGRRAVPLLPRPINSFITALLLRKSPPRIITSPVISPLFSYARDNGHVANHSCASIDHTASLSRSIAFPPPLSSKLSIRLDSSRAFLTRFKFFPLSISDIDRRVDSLACILRPYPRNARIDRIH